MVYPGGNALLAPGDMKCGQNMRTWAGCGEAVLPVERELQQRGVRGERVRQRQPAAHAHLAHHVHLQPGPARKLFPNVKSKKMILFFIFFMKEHEKKRFCVKK